MEDVPSTMVRQFAIPPSIFRGSTTIDQGPRQRNFWVFNDLSNDNPSVEEHSRTHVSFEPKLPGGLTANHQGQDTLTSQRCQAPKPRHSIQPPTSKRYGTKPAPGNGYHSRPNRWKCYISAASQSCEKQGHRVLVGTPPSPTPPEDCISRLPAGVHFPKKPSGCEIIPQTIEPRPGDRSTVYFTRNGVLGMPLQYMHNLDNMDDADGLVNLGLDPMKSRQITLVIAWPGYKEATYEILVYTPLYPATPFVTIYGLRQLTKRELAVETLRCIHRWMIEHPWRGERHGGTPEWELSGEKSRGMSAKLVWLSMISPVGDGRWVTQLQKAPGPR